MSCVSLCVRAHKRERVVLKSWEYMGPEHRGVGVQWWYRGWEYEGGGGDAQISQYKNLFQHQLYSLQTNTLVKEVKSPYRP